LLICLSRLKTEFTITAEQIEKWYGVSAETAHKGLTELTKHNVLTTWTTTRTDPRSPQGFTYERHYRFTPPYDRGRLQSEDPGLPGLTGLGAPATQVSS
jgi:hypothetical protein